MRFWDCRSDKKYKIMSYDRQVVGDPTLLTSSQLVSPCIEEEDSPAVNEDSMNSLTGDKDIDCAVTVNLESMRHNGDAHDAIDSQQQETNVAFQQVTPPFKECNDDEASLKSLNVEGGDLESGPYMLGSEMLEKRECEGNMASSNISTLRDDQINVDVSCKEGQYFHPKVK